jgi:hypothetical protein
VLTAPDQRPLAPEKDPRPSPSGKITSGPAVLVASLERDFWRTRYEALERIVRARAPVIAAWFGKQDRAIFDRAHSAFPHSEDWQLTFLALIALYRVLGPPERLTGHGAKKRQDEWTTFLTQPFILHIHFEEIRRALHNLWQPKRGLRTGTNVLMSRHLPAVYKRIALPDDRRPRAAQIEEWARRRTVDTFAYELLAYARGMGAGNVRRLLSRERSERRSAIAKYDLDILPEHLRNWRSRKGPSSPSSRSK